MNKVYSFMAVGLALTGVIAHLTSTLAFDFRTNTMTAFGNAIYGSPLAFIIMLAPLGFIISPKYGDSQDERKHSPSFILGLCCSYGLIRLQSLYNILENPLQEFSLSLQVPLVL